MHATRTSAPRLTATPNRFDAPAIGTSYEAHTKLIRSSYELEAKDLQVSIWSSGVSVAPRRRSERRATPPVTNLTTGYN